MARDYNHNRRQSSRRKSAPGQMLSIVAAFLLGYFAATVMDVNSLNQWFQREVLANKDEPEKPKQVDSKPRQQAELPKPKFEFYSLLTKEQRSEKQIVKNAKVNAQESAEKTAVNVQTNPAVSQSKLATVNPQPVKTTKVAVVEAKPVSAALPKVASKENFVVQVASFRTRQDAEKVKANLILRGYDVSVVAVNTAQGAWFRVLLGPYNNRLAAEKNLTNLARSEHIKGMLKRMDA